MRDDNYPFTRKVIGIFVIIVVISITLKIFEDVQVNPSACQQGGSPTDLDLANLEFLTISVSSSSSPGQDLRNSTFWSLVGASYARNIATLLPQTVLGFVQGSEMWRNWTVQNLIDPPSWAVDGPVPALNQQFASLQAQVLDSGSSSAALGDVTGFAADVSGFTLEALDFVTFDGLTSLKTLFETGSPELALCASFPGQLAQLYDEAFDQGVPSSARAQDLGSALAITSVMALLGGLTGFSDQFELALADSGLGGAWDTMKPSFEDLGTISPDAANLAMAVLQRLAIRFPADIGSVAGFTLDRIDDMADVLHNDGISTDEIDQKIGSLIQAAGSASGPDDTAEDSDEISDLTGGEIMVQFDDQNRMSLSTTAGTAQWITAKFLQDVIPGLVPKEGNDIAVTYILKEDDMVTVYHYYQGGNQWIPTAPGDVVQPGDKIAVRFALLTRNEFLQSLPQIELADPVGINWLADTSQLVSDSIQGDQLSLNFVQQPPQVEGGTFSVTGTVAAKLGHGSVSGFYLDMKTTDLFGNVRTLRIYYQGYGSASMGINIGSTFVPVDLVSFDGVRQVIVYTRVGPTGDYHEAVTYPAVYPSVLYDLGGMNSYTLKFTVKDYSQSFFIDQVTTVRSMEYEMAIKGSPSDVARIGAEIAYTVAVEKLGLQNVIMYDPSQGGADLITKDGSVVIEARMFQRTSTEVQPTLNAIIQGELTQMVEKVLSDFSKYTSAKTGYVIFSYVDNSNAIHTIVLEVLK
jgi:hypothetical protein